MPNDKLFPELPGEIKDLNDEQLQEALAAHQEIAKRIKARDAELLEGRAAEEVVSQFQEAVVEIKAIQAELEDRAKAEVETAQLLDGLADEALAGADETTTGNGDKDEPKTDEDEDAEDDAEAKDDTPTTTQVETGTTVTTPPSAEVQAEEEKEKDAVRAVEEEAVVASTEIVREPRRMRLPLPTAERSQPEPETNGKMPVLARLQPAGSKASTRASNSTGRPPRTRSSRSSAAPGRCRQASARKSWLPRCSSSTRRSGG